MNIQGIVRNLTSSFNFGAGAEATPTLTRNGALYTQDVRGRYHEAVARGNVFIGANQAAQAVSVALATTYTGLCLSNPVGSGKRLSLLGVRFGLSVAPAAIASLHLIGGYSATVNVTHTTPITPENCLQGSSLSAVGKVDREATIPTPTYKQVLSGGFTAAALYADSGTGNVDLGGIAALDPGGFIAIGALTAVTGFGHLIWEEIDLS